MVLLEERPVNPTRTRITPKRVALELYSPAQRSEFIARILADSTLMGALFPWVIALLQSDDARQQLDGLYHVHQLETRLDSQANAERAQEAHLAQIRANAQRIAQEGVPLSDIAQAAEDCLAMSGHCRITETLDGGRHARILTLLRSPKDAKKAEGLRLWEEIQPQVKRVLDYERWQRLVALRQSAADLISWLDRYMDERGEDGQTTFRKHLNALQEARNNPDRLERAIDRADRALGSYVAKCYYGRRKACKQK